MLAHMQLNRENRPDILVIRSYQAGVLQVKDTRYTGAVILTPSAIMPDWAASASSVLDLELLAPALSLEPEILLLGTGAGQRFPSPRVMAAVMARGIGLEVMDTAAACRTYNILAAEDRDVAAALIL